MPDVPSRRNSTQPFRQLIHLQTSVKHNCCAILCDPVRSCAILCERMKRGRWSCEASTEGSHANRGTLPYYTHVANLRTLICADFRPSLSSKRLGALTVRPNPL